MKCSGVLVNKVVGLSPPLGSRQRIRTGRLVAVARFSIVFFAFCNARRWLEHFVLRPYSERIVGNPSLIGLWKGCPSLDLYGAPQ